WKELAAIRSRQNTWRQSLASLFTTASTVKDADLVEIAHQAESAISELEWGGRVQVVFPSTETAILASYCTKEWLSDNHMVHYISWLTEELCQNLCTEKVVFCDSFFLELVCRAYNAREEYLTDIKLYGWLHQAAQKLVTGENAELATFANPGGVHWTPVVLNFMKKSITYADSFAPGQRAEMEPRLKEALEWWTFLHTGEEFTYEEMAIGSQDDSWNCAIFAGNALAHRYLPVQNPLIRSRDGATKQRLELLLWVVRKEN
ncbi:hypothetical protein BT96DRAFT_778433, partial [Gymnopus androsaceus JB14]